MASQQRFIALIIASGVFCAGCATFKPGGRWPWQTDDPNGPKPERVVAIWSNAVLQSPGTTSTRGFGGRLYFYNDRGQPIEAQGQLVVYAYEDGGPGIEGRIPDRKYVFRAEEFKNHASDTTLGRSYSVWIPWDAALDGDQKEITLLPIFTTSEGGLIVGQQTKHLLPGKPTAPVETPWRGFAQSNASEARLASFHQGEGAPGAEERAFQASEAARLRTTTITLPPDVRARMANSVPSDHLTRQGAANQQMGPWNVAVEQRSTWPETPPDARASQKPSRAALPGSPGARQWEADVNDPEQPSTRSGHLTPPAPTWPIARPRASHAPWRPRPGG